MLVSRFLMAKVRRISDMAQGKFLKRRYLFPKGGWGFLPVGDGVVYGANKCYILNKLGFFRLPVRILL